MKMKSMSLVFLVVLALTMPAYSTTVDDKDDYKNESNNLPDLVVEKLEAKYNDADGTLGASFRVYNKGKAPARHCHTGSFSSNKRVINLCLWAALELDASKKLQTVN